VHARRTAWAVAALAAMGLVGPAQAAWASPGPNHDDSGGLARVVQSNVVSDIPGMATLTDPHLVNPWGLSYNPISPLWISNAGTNTSTLISGAPPALPNAIPTLMVDIPGGPPTGQVSNFTTGFSITGSLGTSQARFIFAGLGGSITAWTPLAEATDALVVATTPGASYTGLTMLQTADGPELLAADFTQGRIDVFDQNFHKVASGGLFTDRNLPPGFHPFNVQAVGTDVYVTYAKIDPATGHSVDGHGLGVVDKFTREGTHLDRVAQGGTLNAPWGVAVAPAGFGSLTGELLVGNFGDGRVSLFDTADGQHFRDFLRTANGQPFQVDRLWALLPGSRVSGGVDAIWFSAGIVNETHGLVGTLKVAPTT
jgi:uncharacterized protein (TIGR03118 family)